MKTVLTGSHRLTLLLGALLLAADLGWGADAAPSLKLCTFPLGEWYTVTCPEVFHIGTVAEITVAYRGIEEKTKLCCDLHYLKVDGSSGGFYATDSRPELDITGEGQYTFTVPISEGEGLAAVSILLFTDPEAEWGSHTRFAQSEPVPVTDPSPGYAAWLKGMKWNKSWIAFDWSTLRGALTEGDRAEVTLEYYLDPAEHFETTTLRLEALGPRVPKPEAPKPVAFADTQHLWYGQQSASIEPGRGKHTFALTVPKASRQNALLLLALFCESRGNRWPWDVRAEAWYQRRGGFFELKSDKPGNLFTYDEPVRLAARLRNVAEAGQEKVLRYAVWDAGRTLEAEGTVPFTVERDGQEVPIELSLAQRGTFLLRAEVEGWEARETAFCRIPDLAAITGGKPTPFGMTIHAAPALGDRTEEVVQVARRLGLTTCRAFTEWNTLEPGPGVYKLEDYDAFFDLAHRHGLSTVICIWRPPAWVLPVGEMISYRMFECDLKAWEEMVRTVSARYRGRFWGWEWLNEISPGGTPNCAEDYTTLCRVGTETARAADPSLRFTLAGGLWPRGYRLDVLSAGAGRYIDVLPVHYGNGSGIAEAREDLDSFGHGQVAVWENESAAPLIVWEWPGLDVVSDTTQARWVLSQWPDELAAGAERVIYFGGEGNSIGDYDYLFADLSPRPIAATLAVLVSKLWDARPVGTIASLGKAGLFHLFERRGRAVLVASTGEEGGEEVPLTVGSEAVRVTDYRGNEVALPATKGVATLPLKPLACFVEGADLDVLKAHLVPAIQTPSGGGKREQLGIRPQVTMLKGQPASVAVRLRNLYRRRLAGQLGLDLPTGWAAPGDLSFSLAPGESKLVQVPVTVPEATEPAAFPCRLTVAYAWPKLPRVEKPFVASVISREQVGNLLRNGGFEEAEADGVTPVAWQGTNAKLQSSEGIGLGLGKRILKFEKAANWEQYSQQLALRGGTTYLYTAWIWNQGMSGGSNISQTMRDGSRVDLYDKQAIDIGDSTPYWQVFTCRYKAPEELASASFVPCTMGGGAALYDNVRVTVFEGTDFAAEAYRVQRPPTIDGNLEDWDRRCPIPLIGRNQLRVIDPGYQWAPANLSGVAYVSWDDQNLYLAVEVRDDVHQAGGEGQTVIEGDSLVLAFDPTARGPDAAQQAFAYYVSSRPPGSGSGVHTLWRPAEHSGGRTTGHLARDSSVYDLAIKPDSAGCVYELRIPFTELGGFSPAFGAKLGFAIQLNDNDERGPAAQMTWGGGLSPAWSPSGFGLVVLME